MFAVGTLLHTDGGGENKSGGETGQSVAGNRWTQAGGGWNKCQKLKQKV